MVLSPGKFLRLRWCCFRRQPLWTLVSVVVACCIFTVFLPVFWSTGLFGSFSPFSKVVKDHPDLLLTNAFNNGASGKSSAVKHGRPEVPFQCPQIAPLTSISQQQQQPASASSTANLLANIQKFKLKPHSKVLLLLQSSQYSQLATDLVVTFEWARLPYRAELIKHSLPYLTRSDLGKYALVVFENASSYFEMDLWNRQLLHTYCRQFGVGLAAFVSDLPSSASSFTFKHTPDGSDFIAIRKIASPPDSIILTNNSNLLRISRPGLVWQFNGDTRPIFTDTLNGFHFSNSSAFRVLASVLPADRSEILPVVVEDPGLIDGVHRVLFGHPTLSLWLNRVLFLDSLSLLLSSNSSPDQLPAPLLPLDRYLQVDIDDIFVGSAGKRLLVHDVQELLALQRRLQAKISPNFRLNLGYSGGYFLHGDDNEDAADRLLVSKSSHFNWFHHSWLHRRPHLLSYDKVAEDILMNIDFARRHALPLDRSYSIAPFHSGVYPVHEPLFAAWHDILGVVATATEHFPHSRPLWKRRGFIHSASGVKVLPRLPIGLYTHTNYFDEFPGGGKAALDSQIQGGLLFNIFLFNPVAVFMTHQSNYALDRMAPYAIESLVNFVQCYTRLSIRYLPPSHLANVYFALYPNDTDPVWTNPCDDRNHLALWSPNKTCTQLPDLLIVGPQKTGSTAFAQFLSIHPKAVVNTPTRHGFEETQFFNDPHYVKGLDWYLSLFPNIPPQALMTTAPSQKSSQENGNVEEVDENNGEQHNLPLLTLPVNRSEYVVFEKSATYFDNELAITRIRALLPRAKIIVLIEDPGKRAYSWYQHQRARGNHLALNASFYEVLTLNAQTVNGSLLKSLRSRCLHPGHYAQHIDKWLMSYSASQIFFVDSNQLALDPPSVLNEVQKFLHLEPIVDYYQLLRLDRIKGFYCQIDAKNASKLHCLGKSKGRKYPPMDDASRQYLSSYYRSHNLRLLTMLRHLGYKIPNWLRQEFASPTTTGNNNNSNKQPLNGQEIIEVIPAALK